MIMKNLRNCLSLKHEVGGQGEENGEGDANRNFIDHQKKERKRERQIQNLGADRYTNDLGEFGDLLVILYNRETMTSMDRKTGSIQNICPNGIIWPEKRVDNWYVTLNSQWEGHVTRHHLKMSFCTKMEQMWQYDDALIPLKSEQEEGCKVECRVCSFPFVENGSAQEKA